ncbi:MAG: SpoIIE family protein phosphatase [Ruminococcus sp.]|nr:SpoIIE family protein phosphatase [Ruminococcus sp.]
MSEMIIKMSLITCLMCLLNVLIRQLTKGRELSALAKLLIGAVFGGAAVISTHFGVNYEAMVLNVRDIAPLSAGLFFGPLAGITAGIIGGIERYIAGIFFGVGSYTAVACSVSTCIAGLISAGFNKYIFKGKKPSPFYALFIGCVTEVFHMFAVFVTHRGDIINAFHVVDTCAIPMIIFTGIGMCVSSVLLSALSGEYRDFHKPDGSEVPITMKFQMWLFSFIAVMAVSTFMFSYSIQTRQTLQSVQNEMKITADELEKTLVSMDENTKNAIALTKQQALNIGHALAREIESTGGIAVLTDQRLEELRKLYGIYELNAISSEGFITSSTNPDFVGFDMRSGEQSAAFMALIDGTQNELLQDYMPITADSSISVMYTGVAVSDGAIQVGFDDNNIKAFSDLADLGSTLDDRHVGENGFILVADLDGLILTGGHKDESLDDYDCIREDGVFFSSRLGEEEYYCLSKLTDSYRVIVAMPHSEVYRSRDISAYETAFADILLFTLVFVLIYILVQRIIVNNLDRINESLGRITGGDLNEVVSVSSSVEFASLSKDINATVETLKRYITEAENRIDQELEFARTIQTSTLPQNFDFPNRNEFELFASMDTAKEVGGDFYDFFFVDKNKLALVIADVSGKGIPAALYMMRSKATIKSLAESGKSPAEIFTKANALLCDGNDAEMFVTAWIGIIDLETGIMKCANAGHEYPAIRRASSDGYELFKDKHGFVLGGMEGVRYKEYELTFDEGDRLFVYTDGVPEANNINGEQLGTERMLGSLNSENDMTVSETLQAVKNCIDTFCIDADQFDDITMLGFEFIKKTDKEE